MSNLENQTTITPNLTQQLMQLYEMEAKEGIESFRWLATQLIQVATVLAIANLTVVGYAASNKQAGLFLFGAGITTILLIAYSGGMLGAVPLLCRLLALESTATSILNRSFETGISLTLLNILGPAFLTEAQKINGITNLLEKQKAMRNLSMQMITRMPTRVGTFILFLAILLQVVFVPIFVYIFYWKLF